MLDIGSMSMLDRMSLVTHRGSCHCGNVSIEVVAPVDLRVYECNCSICTKSAYLHLIVPADRFRLLTGRDDLTSYRFNTGQANHLFCRECGVKPFYVPRSHPDGYSVNVRCLDRQTIGSVEVVPFDGANWEQHIDEMRT